MLSSDQPRASIQNTKAADAHDSALTLDGYTIRVIADNYDPGVVETVNVTKEVTIETDTGAAAPP